MESIKHKRSEYIKTKFPGIYYVQDSLTKVKTYIARIKVAGLIEYKKNQITPAKIYLYEKFFYKHISDKLQKKKIKELQKEINKKDQQWQQN